MGMKIREATLLFIIPFFLILLCIKNRGRDYLHNFKVLSVFVIGALIFNGLAAIKSGHTVSLINFRFSVFSTPYFIIIMGLSIYAVLYLELNKIFYIITRLAIVVQLAIMIYSTILIYSGYDSTTKWPNTYEMLARKIQNIRASGPNDEFTILFKTPADAVEMNKYLDKSLVDTKQIIIKSETDPLIYLLYSKDQTRVIIQN